jgi:hypothetical protein
MSLSRRERRTRESPAARSDVDPTHAAQRRKAPSLRVPSDIDSRIAALANVQDGLVTRPQLLALPLSSSAIDGRIRAGRLHPRFRGVYAVGHAAESPRSKRRAALLAVGADGALSHMTCAHLAGVWALEPPEIHVLVVRSAPRSRPGLIVHETRRPFEPVICAGFPVTPMLRTLEDLAAIVPPGDLERACGEALVRRLVTQRQLDEAGLTDPDRPPPASVFARDFQRVLHRAHLPVPVIEHAIGRYTADFAWPDRKVIVETDGYDAHGHRKRFESDRARDAYLMARGWVVVRVTWRRLKREPMALMVELGQILALRTTS